MHADTTRLLPSLQTCVSAKIWLLNFYPHFHAQFVCWNTKSKVDWYLIHRRAEIHQSFQVTLTYSLINSMLAWLPLLPSNKVTLIFLHNFVCFLLLIKLLNFNGTFNFSYPQLQTVKCQLNVVTTKFNLPSKSSPKLGPKKCLIFPCLTWTRPLDFSKTFPKCRDICYERTISTADPGKTLVRVRHGLLGLKTPHFCGFSDFCVISHYVCLYTGLLWRWIQIY